MNRYAIRWLAPWVLGVLLSLDTATAIAADGDGHRADPDRYLVRFAKGENISAARDVISNVGGKVLSEIPNARIVAARIPAEELQRLRRNPNVERIERDLPRVAMAQSVPYGITMVQADQVADVVQEQIKVCVIDSGLDAGHEDLTGSAITGTDLPGSEGGIISWDSDLCGHGTHVAGTIMAQDNALGVLGIAPRVPIHIVNVFENQAAGECDVAYTSTILNAIDACQDAGADVINMSLGCVEDGSSSCYSAIENDHLQAVYDQGALLVSSAGNDGSTLPGYPASYAAVVSVAAVDENGQVAGFSQQNSEVELAAPGVGVLSTVPIDSGESSALLSIAGVQYGATVMAGSPNAEAIGELVDCGLAMSPCTVAASGKTCLIQRGDITFAEKVTNCQTGGGGSAVIYNNIPGIFFGTLGTTATQIPSVGISQSDGQALLAKSIGAQSVLSVEADDYAYFSGTSMAAPHVTGVAALVWSQNPDWTNTQIRDALAAGAADLGPVGRDSAFGHGLVQSRSALDYLVATTGAPLDHASLAVISNPGQAGGFALSVALRDGARYFSNVVDRNGITLNRVPLSPETVMAHLVVDDLNGNAADELMSLEVKDDGRVQAKIKDSMMGDLIVKMPFEADYDPLWVKALPDTSLDGSMDLAVLGINSDGRVRAQVRDALSGALVSRVFFDASYAPFGFEVIEDLNGDSLAEIAVIGVDDVGRVRAQVKDVMSGQLISLVYFDRSYVASHVTGVDMDGDGYSDALAVLGENAGGVVRAQVKDVLTANRLGIVRFESGYTAHKLLSMQDTDVSGIPELALLQSDGAGSTRVQVKDAATGQAISTVSFDATYDPRDLAVLPRVTGPGLAFLGEASTGDYLLQIKDAVTGQAQVYRTF